MSALTEATPILMGQVWRHRREGYRRVLVTGVQTVEPFEGAPYEIVHVERNTSRRTQSIKPATLRREYALERSNPAGAW